MKTDKQTVYIAGPMRGAPFYNFPAFDAARDKLIDEGWIVVSPADIDRVNGFDPKNLPADTDWNDVSSLPFTIEDCFDRDMEAVRGCNAIYMLNGWSNSTGAQAEYWCARWLHKHIMMQEEKVEESTPRGPTESPFPTESQERLKYPVFSGVLMYFADAIAELAKHSLDSFKQHNPVVGPIWWDPSKSVGTLDQLIRHLIDAQVAFNAGDFKKAKKESAAVHWRAAELHQRMLKGMPPFER